MGERVNYTEKEVKDIIKSFPLVPTGDKLFITLNTEDVDGKLVLSDNVIAEDQYIIAVGDMASRQFEEGEKVVIDIKRMTVKEYADHDQTQVVTRVEVDTIEVEGKMFGVIFSKFVKAKYK